MFGQAPFYDIDVETFGSSDVKPSKRHPDIKHKSYLTPLRSVMQTFLLGM